MVAKKSKSKRQSLQQKYKIKKRTKEHHKRIKKGRLNVNGKKSKNNDNFIPNSWPYKEDLLKEIKIAQEKMESVKLRQKEKRSDEIMKRRAGLQSSAMDIADPIESFPEADNEVDEGRDVSHTNLGQNSRRAYLRELRKVVETADVILHVLDARDPIGTQSSAIEEMVLSNSRKKLVYVLNKADLVPKEVLSGWLTYLRKFHPTIPFKCNTQTGSGNLGRISGKLDKHNDSALQTSQAVGAEELISLLKNYCRMGDMKSIISVGAVGFPNVGKSSLINSLLRSRAVGVSAMPGFTKTSQEVILDKNIRLVDCPGVVFADGDSASTALRNCVNVEELEDVMTPIQAILDRCPQPYLMQLYTIPRFKTHDAMAFLALVAKSTGRLKKGGIPNVDAAARGVLHDWNSGKIKYYVKPPVINNAAEDANAKIINAFSPAFDVDVDGDVAVMDAIESQRIGNQSYVAMDKVAEKIDIHIGDEDKVPQSNHRDQSKQKKSHIADHMGADDNDEVVDEDKKSAYSTRSSRHASSSSDERLQPIIDESTIGTDSRKVQKRMKKKVLKDSKRETKKSTDTDIDYSFEEDFQY